MLSLVGLGLCDEKDLTVRGIELAKSADIVYIELYTNAWKGLDKLADVIGKSAIKLNRSDLEQGAGRIIEEASEKDVVIFIPGDPMVATTHVTLVSDAIKMGVKVSIVHNSSITSAIAETGLHIYKFGAIATVPFPDRTGGELPESVYDTLRMNKRNGLHTLLLLDIVPERCMTPNEAMKIMLKAEESRNGGVFTPDSHVIVFARAGSPDATIRFGTVSEFLNEDFGEPPMVLIVPGKLHFSEKEHLVTIK